MASFIELPDNRKMDNPPSAPLISTISSGGTATDCASSTTREGGTSRDPIPGAADSDTCRNPKSPRHSQGSGSARPSPFRRLGWHDCASDCREPPTSRMKRRSYLRRPRATRATGGGSLFDQCEKPEPIALRIAPMIPSTIRTAMTPPLHQIRSPIVIACCICDSSI